MLWIEQKVGCLLKLFAREFVTAAKKRGYAKRERASLSSLLADTQWESNRLTKCDKARLLVIGGTDRSQSMDCGCRDAINGGIGVRELKRIEGPGDDCCVRAGGVRRVIPALAFGARLTAISVVAHY